MKAEWQRAGAYVIALAPQNQLLLTQFEKPGHPRSGAWTLPGGGMEWGEQAHETALREFKEETGLTAEIGPILATNSEWMDGTRALNAQPGHAIRLIFEARTWTGDLKRDFSDDDTTVAAKWFPLHEVADLDKVPVVDFALKLISAKPT